MPQRIPLSALLLASALALPSTTAAVDRLIESPRHQEWVTIPSHGKALRAFLVLPEVNRPATTVIVIHEDRGLTNWVRTVADRLAEAGYLAVAPDLLSGRGPNGGGTPDFATPEEARNALFELVPGVITADLNAVAGFMKDLRASNGVVTVAGFGWGGAQSFRFASEQADLAAAFVFYGIPPGGGFEKIRCPVYGFYGSEDSPVNATIPLAEDVMEAHHKIFEPQIYHRAGHAFMRLGEGPGANDGNRIAMNASWDRWLAILGAPADPADKPSR